jgi:deoxyadenosine/deoxycytidine kinase
VAPLLTTIIYIIILHLSIYLSIYLFVLLLKLGDGAVTETTVIVMDRGVQGDELFAELQCEDGNMTHDQLKTYKSLSDTLSAVFPEPSLTVILDVPPTLCK